MLLFANDARGILTGAVTAAAGQVAALQAGQGALFVGVGGVATSSANPMRCVLTAVDANGNDTGTPEIVEVVRAGDNLTLQSRGLEGTTAAAWPIGTVIECRETAGIANARLMVGGGLGLIMPPGAKVRVPISGSIISDSASILSFNTLFFLPTFVSRAFVLAQIGFYLALPVAAAGSVMRFGLYADDGSGRPGNLLLDAGVLATDTTNGYRYITGLSYLVPSGLFWIGYAPQGSGTPLPNIEYQPYAGTQIPATVDNATAWALKQSGVTGALPGTASPDGASQYSMVAILVAA